MQFNQSDFIWPVPAEGFSVEQADGTPYLVAWNRVGGKVPRFYEPLKSHPTLFREFASLNDEKIEEIQGFANRFGLLGFKPLGEERSLGARVSMQEPIGAWMAAIRHMRSIVSVWDMLTNQDTDGLHSVIRWTRTVEIPEEVKDTTFPPMREESRAVVVFCATGFRKRGDRINLIEPPMPGLFTPDDLLLPAMVLVQRKITLQLCNEFSVRFDNDFGKGTRTLLFVPKSLIGAMWFQFSQAVADNKRYRRCKAKDCTNHIEVKSDGKKGKRLFCSDECKFRDYTQRRKQGQQLRAEGKTAEQIAHITDTDIKTVNKWLGITKEGK